jgi:MFS family permease
MVLWSSQVVSTVGARVSTIAFPLLVLAMTHSPAKAGVVGFAQTLPFLLLYLPAGAFIDRWDRKRTMLVCDAGRAVALGSIAITAALGWLSLAQVALVALVDGSLFVLFDLAEGAALPHLVAKEQVPAAVAQNQAKIQGADVVGQPLGGVLFSVARLLPFLADAVTYLVSFGALLLIRRPFQQPRARPPTRLVTPDLLLGRVRSAARLVAWGSIPLGSLAGGFGAAAFGAQTTLLILTGIMGGVAAAATFARGMRI